MLVSVRCTVYKIETNKSASGHASDQIIALLACVILRRRCRAVQIRNQRRDELFWIRVNVDVWGLPGAFGRRAKDFGILGGNEIDFFFEIYSVFVSFRK